MSDSINIALRFGSKKHARIIAALNARREMSESDMEEIYSDLEDMEDQYLAYMPETDADAVRRSRRDDQGKPSYTTIKIPYSYAILLSAHTFWTSVFLGRSPILQFSGRHGETQQQTQAVEALADYQVHIGRLLPVYYLWMHDAPKYGFGVKWDYWATETKQVARIVKEPRSFFGAPIPGTERRIKRSVRIPGYQGTRSFNVRPYDYLPDTRVPLMNPQDGEFVGRKCKFGWNELIKGQADDRYFNLDAVKRIGAKAVQSDEWGTENGPEKVSTDEIPAAYDIQDVGHKDGYEMVVELIPKDWHLGSAETPEKWVFTVIDDQVVIEARPFGALHDEFPVDVLPMEFDAYSLNYRSMLDTIKPLNDTLDWLINTHFFNVRSALNNNFVFDPLRVVTKDLTREGPVKLIRLKEAAYGSDVRSVIQQLEVKDVTQGHLRDSALVTDLIQRVSGVTDAVMGMMQGGGRKTATEVRTSSSFGVNRLKTMAEYWSAVGFGPHAQRMIAATQQYYDGEQQFKIAGSLMGQAQKFVEVRPEMLAGMYDFVPVDGTLPIDRYAQANLWKEILMGMAKMPMIGQQYDLGGIFAWMAQLAGLKNIDQFKVQVVPDMALQQQAAAGNVVPIPEAAREGEPRPGQISGMGPTG